MWNFENKRRYTHTYTHTQKYKNKPLLCSQVTTTVNILICKLNCMKLLKSDCFGTCLINNFIWLNLNFLCFFKDYSMCLCLQGCGHVVQTTLYLGFFFFRLRAGGEGSDRRWDGWMSSPTQWTWIWANSRR